MAERPILMSAPMVLAVLKGMKTQTRRVIVEGKAPFWFYATSEGVNIRLTPTSYTWFPNDYIEDFKAEAPAVCPYGQPGDRLWVRESFRALDPGDGIVDYRADGVTGKWTPSIHMPRWASRITLEIVKVRVEQVQDISMNDAKAEGITCTCEPEDRCLIGNVAHFKHLWNRINAKRGFGWNENPWVWVLEFRVVPRV